MTEERSRRAARWGAWALQIGEVISFRALRARAKITAPILGAHAAQIRHRLLRSSVTHQTGALPPVLGAGGESGPPDHPISGALILARALRGWNGITWPIFVAQAPQDAESLSNLLPGGGPGWGTPRPLHGPPIGDGEDPKAGPGLDLVGADPTEHP